MRFAMNLRRMSYLQQKDCRLTLYLRLSPLPSCDSRSLGSARPVDLAQDSQNEAEKCYEDFDLTCIYLPLHSVPNFSGYFNGLQNSTGWNTGYLLI
mmetsp:Transcript_34212/g.89976  ORF Transcript_34212/g.89976 Transcript_34212/m.89976 type:complete len:96 (-) Transcript_34212:540-827(-)